MAKKLVLILAIVLFAATQSFATPPALPSQADSVYIGVFTPRTNFEGDIKGISAGEGVGAKLGFSVENVLSSEFIAFKSWHNAGPSEKVAFNGLALDIKLSLPLFPVVAPYGFVGLGQYTLETPQSVYRGETKGNGINGYEGGYGLEMYMSKKYSLNLGYTERRMKFDAGTPGGVTLKAITKTYDLGFTVHFY